MTIAATRAAHNAYGTTTLPRGGGRTQSTDQDEAELVEMVEDAFHQTDSLLKRIANAERLGHLTKSKAESLRSRLYNEGVVPFQALIARLLGRSPEHHRATSLAQRAEALHVESERLARADSLLIPAPADIALHEAGHALAAALRGNPVLKVELWRGPDEAWRGLCTHDPRSGWDMVIVAAGAAAVDLWQNPDVYYSERAFGNGTASLLSNWNDGSDMSFIYQHWHALEYQPTGIHSCEQYARAWVKAAQELLHGHMNSVRAVAAALLEKRELSGNEVTRLIQTAALCAA